MSLWGGNDGEPEKDHRDRESLTREPAPPGPELRHDAPFT